ncbi:hypothetical protein GCM10025868_08870 [Angustibacter aerolatus]|uniref:Uncharacterized protein n=1 Tax=Angustibacter aerolatus TaxID=1162965 RepID=A0ABQ6JFF4_9ACTN|nr:hypothetical protein GCM10025868_08870 [Angustibacter aerolatus]
MPSSLLGQVAQPGGGLAEQQPRRLRVDPRADVGDHGLVERVVDLDDPLLDPAGAGDEHHEQPPLADRHQARRAAPSTA